MIGSEKEKSGKKRGQAALFPLFSYSLLAFFRVSGGE
jgi:hypothetical protein